MSNSKGRNINLVKAHNKSAILLGLLREDVVSRVELAEHLSLSNTTITNLTAELLEADIIAEEEIKTAPRNSRVGRPRRMLRLLPAARYAVGVHIGIGIFRIAVTNLFAEIVANQMAQFDLNTPAEAVVAEIAALVDETIAQSGVARARILGVGVGASGLVENATGINVVAPRLNWVQVPLKTWLEERLNLPVCVDNNVRSMALGEAFFGAGRNANLLAFVYGRVGVGAGFVLDGRLFRGSRAGAGEIGHTVILPHGGEVCSCGKRGCLETLISEPVLLKEAKNITTQHPTGLLAQHMAQNDPRSPIERVFDAARAGDAPARTLIEDRACYLGIALANLVNMLNPELILLGGMFAQGHDLILPVAEAKMREIAFAGLGENVRVLPSEFGWRAGVIGAASLALTTFFYQQAEGN